jgi:hypothetical protein
MPKMGTSAEHSNKIWTSRSPAPVCALAGEARPPDEALPARALRGGPPQPSLFKASNPRVGGAPVTREDAGKASVSRGTARTPPLASHRAPPSVETRYVPSCDRVIRTVQRRAGSRDAVPDWYDHSPAPPDAVPATEKLCPPDQTV